MKCNNESSAPVPPDDGEIAATKPGHSESFQRVKDGLRAAYRTVADHWLASTVVVIATFVGAAVHLYPELQQPIAGACGSIVALVGLLRLYKSAPE